MTHHPLIFKPVSRITDSDFIGERLMKLMKHDICCYAMHTNFDSAPGCMGDAAAGMLGLEKTQVLEQEGLIPFETPEGIKNFHMGLERPVI